MLTEPTGLVLKVLIYSGQSTDVSLSQSHTEHVVNKLMENHLTKAIRYTWIITIMVSI